MAVLVEVIERGSMLRMRRLVEATAPPEAVDDSAVVPEIRPQIPRPTFGIVRPL